LANLGWIEGRNLRIELRFADGSLPRMRDLAAEVVKLDPEAILTASGAVTEAVGRETQTIPIVTSGAGEDRLVAMAGSIARPKGNVTGFAVLYGSIAGKWLQLLKEVAPHITRVAVVFDPDTMAGGAHSDYRRSIEAAANALNVTAEDAPFRSEAELERAITTFATAPGGGLIVLPTAPTTTRENRQLILLLAARHRLPVMHFDKEYPAEGGLISYGSDTIDLNRRSATYIDRILRGAKISELPVQFPTKFELVINLKAAKVIGLAVPEAFLLRADQVIE
jgi:putative tryptophan/tyrosine transport system substrate-binding protein